MDPQPRPSPLQTASDIRFISDIGHELRTPLNAIIGFTGTLLMRLPGPLNADQEQQLLTIKSSAQRLLALINDIVDVAKVDSGKVGIELEDVPIRAVVEEVIVSSTPFAERKGLAVELSDGAMELVARADRRALSQILSNLIDNAIKFTQTGGVKVSIARLDSESGAKIAMSVSDTGVGIADSDQARLFDAFAQFAPPNGNRPEGTGLGLYLSRKLAALMDGEITFASSPGQGSTFTLMLCSV